MRKIDLVASGFISFDRIVKIDRPPQIGRTSVVLNANSADVHFGGCSINICYLLAKLGKNTLPIVRVGDDAQQYGFFKHLASAGVLQEGVRHVPETNTSHAYLIEDNTGEHITLFHPGSMAGHHAKPLDQRWFEQTKMAAIVVGAPEDNLLMLEQVKQHQVPLIFGMRIDKAAFPEAILKNIMAETSYLFMNQAESKALCEIYDIFAITELFALTKLKIIVTTLGANGSRYHQLTENGVSSGEIPAVKIPKIVDPAGAGDAYIAGFTYGLLENKPIRLCAEYGSTLASFVLEAIGCTTHAPDLKTFSHRHQQHYGGQT